jgi:hypothetical protein
MRYLITYHTLLSIDQPNRYGKSEWALLGGGGRVARDAGNSLKGPRFDPGWSHKDFAGVSETGNLC